MGSTKQYQQQYQYRYGTLGGGSGNDPQYGGSGSPAHLSGLGQATSYIGSPTITLGNSLLNRNDYSNLNSQESRSQNIMGPSGQMGGSGYSGASGSVANLSGSRPSDWIITPAIESRILCNPRRSANLSGGKTMSDYDDDVQEAKVITSIAIRQEDSYEADKQKEKFSKTVEFIEAGLNLSEDQLNKMKVKDLAKKFKEAENEITVGNMKKFMGMGKTYKRGVIGSLWRNIKFMFQSKKKVRRY